MIQTFDPDAVRTLLQERGWSVNELARRLDLDATRVRGWLNGRHVPSLESLDRLAAVLGVDPAQLLKTVETPGPGQQGAVPLSPDEVLVMTLIMRLAQDDPHQIAQSILDRLPWRFREAVVRELVLPAGWEALWRRLHAKVPPTPVWAGFRLHVQLQPPARTKTGGGDHPVS